MNLWTTLSTINQSPQSESVQFIDHDGFNNEHDDEYDDEYDDHNDPIEEASWFMFEGYKQYEHFYGRGMVR